jgi:hypothetical protein
MFRYRLAPGVYACASDAGAVLLDLETDAYVGLDVNQSRALSLVVRDWPVQAPCAPCDPAPSSDDALAFAQILCDRRLLIPASASQGCGTSHSAVPTIESELMGWEQMNWRHIRVGHVLRFIQSLLTAILLLRVHRFADVVERARVRKSRHSGEATLHAETMCALLSAFFHIRTFFYAPRSRCLLDSLALVEFLAHYRQFPQWVIGVQIDPFGAHSWVQQDEFVLNGATTYVRAYTPIFSV